jgi:hypothetical protein
MPSSIASGPKFRSIKGGGRWRIAPDFLITVNVAAANFSGANSGINVFVVPDDVNGAVFLGGDEVHVTAGTNNFRVKKITAGEVDAPGAGADADNVTISEVVDLTVAAQTPQAIVPITDDAVNILAPGTRVALASAAGTASLAGGLVHLRFAWL